MTDTPDDAPNEIVVLARACKERSDAAARTLKTRKTWPIARISLGVGIGSAAVAAALLFANRSEDR